jgi:teichuronic acid biosynthesis glycosyltransferase TuaC
MNILAISHLFPRVGEERNGIFVARQLSAMYKLGAEIRVLVPLVWCPRILRYFNRWKNYDHKREICKFEGIEAVSFPYIRPPGNWYNRWSGLVVFRAIRKKALKLHQKKNFDIIYATDFFPDGDAAVRLAKYMKLPAACLSIGADINITAHSTKAIHRHFVKTARVLNGTLACGQSVANGIDAVTNRHSLCVYGVVDLEEFSPASDKVSLRKELGLPLNKMVALYAGYIQERKGIYEMLEAFCRIHKVEPNVMLCVCGGGEEEMRFTQMVRERNLEHIIRILGEVATDQMNKWMKASDLLVLATHTEGMPNVVMEAMACGLPVVTTAVGGLPEAIGNCEGAILVPPWDVDKFKDAVLKVLRNEQLRERMGLAARKLAEEKFGVQRNARRILDFLSEIIKYSRKQKPIS